MRTMRRAVLGVGLAGVVLLASCSDDEPDAGSTTTAAESAPATTAEAAAAVTTEAAADTSSPESTAPPTTTGGLLDAPISPLPALFTEDEVQNAVDQLDEIVDEAMERTGVPGIAVGVVYKDEVVFAEGYGVRKVGEPETIDPATVFQVASVSKTLASTIVAGVVGQGRANWTDPVITWNPDFAFSDPYVTANATIADLLSHRTGLPGISGNLLEDLGWDRDYILSVLRLQPLEPFRATYDYSDFGVTEGGVTAADAMGMTWEDLADSLLFQPLGMEHSSYRHADYEAEENKALIHVPVGPLGEGTWEARYVRNADAEAPAGGLSTSVDDMTQFLRLQLGHGTVDGTEIVDAAALQVTHVPHQDLSQPTTPGVRTQFYGLCWNVIFDDEGRVRLDHSGAFDLGAATNVMLIDTEELGIVTLTNGQPHGIPEAINNAFFDVAQNGAPTVDWLGFFGRGFEGLYEAEDQQGEQWRAPPAAPAPAAAETAYVGTYLNPYYGPLTVTFDGGALNMSMGPPASPTTFVLAHFDGNTFTYDTIGENASGKSAAVFTMGADGTATSVNLPFYDTTGLGTFTRG